MSLPWYREKPPLRTVLMPLGYPLFALSGDPMFSRSVAQALVGLSIIVLTAASVLALRDGKRATGWLGLVIALSPALHGPEAPWVSLVTFDRALWWGILGFFVVFNIARWVLARGGAAPTPVSA